ncbi:Prophage CP4-57 regulatory protein (AlpA) [Aequorivita sublithincola DSM 14238]|uniref:Prophage CP4-57 regulatory protein (AlpA) n=1 Tax=Aequorivita sublithincola (strain DSM 14238 / LMG 21431 / ACAM 643 / 9-3) TaxID=746697 RepID=I3YRT7_AEQSU|nr:helix-turn-helix domain-containing protein [Aequorivita sublithincola]AFL79705.1 Prophage CP4-57 regulatory protein (AlpA) [Aequorivita sublithincola DSM 14238]
MDSKRKKIRRDWKKKIALREEEVMEMLGLSKSTMRRLHSNREIPHSKLGITNLYMPKELKKT